LEDYVEKHILRITIARELFDFLGDVLKFEGGKSPMRHLILS
jgi:hypothetical protein